MRRLTAKGRALLVGRVLGEGWSVVAASEAAGVSQRTGHKWLARYRSEGLAGLADRSSRPHRSPRASSEAERIELEHLRRQRWPQWRIARHAGRSLATVSRRLRHSRVPFAQILPDETSASCVAFLRAAVAHCAALGVRIVGVMTDNGTGYKNTFKAACDELDIRHIKTRPYTPRTNGKAERFVQTSLHEWAYARPYLSSAEREAALEPFLHRCNWHRPHTALNDQPPMTRIAAMNNLLRLNS